MGAKETTLSGLEHARNNSYETLVSDSLNNSSDQSPSMMQVTENATVSVVSE